jgi:hypothetical protein
MLLVYRKKVLALECTWTRDTHSQVVSAGQRAGGAVSLPDEIDETTHSALFRKPWPSSPLPPLRLQLSLLRLLVLLLMLLILVLVLVLVLLVALPLCALTG